MISVALSDSDDLDTGELVLAEKPLFTVPAEAHNSDLDQYLESAVQVPVFVFFTVFVSVFGEQLGGTDKYKIYDKHMTTLTVFGERFTGFDGDCDGQDLINRPICDFLRWNTFKL